MKLESLTREEYGDEYNSAVLEQWKTCVEMANNNAEKRNNSNNVFITINSALLAVITFSLDYKSILLSVVGIVLCTLWMKSIDSYKRLGRMKYLIVDEIEKKLPLTPFSCEWKELKNDHKYFTLTKIEKFMPWIFIALFSLAIIFPLTAKIIR
ncbi:MAG: hypothetical protein E7505_08980 [Ruminococcus sp.]|jgi:hypothetical protein|nr:hypothetical protein [Ruminococcus sp.]